MSSRPTTPLSRLADPSNDASSGAGQSASGADTIEDVQGWSDARRITIDWVGVRDVRHPLTVRDASGQPVPVTATVSMAVGLAADRKGTHMSRFLELLGDVQHEPLSVNALDDLMAKMLERLDASTGRIDIGFTFFRTKQAPVSGAVSMSDYDVKVIGTTNADGATETRLEAVVPVTSLCPCSKEISDYGAHNQRSHVTTSVVTAGEFPIEDLLDLVESQASSELYGVLKRADEKFVTERAYDNPKFVEDIVRDVARSLKTDDRITAWSVTCENFESIHNHSAWATITSDT